MSVGGGGRDNGEGRDPDSGIGDDRPEGPGRLDVEAAWADIVSRWGSDEQAPVGRWPAQEDVDDPAAPGAGASGQPGDAPPEEERDRPAPASGAVNDPVPASWVQGEATRPGEDDERRTRDEDRYVPPEPPPFPRGDDMVTRLAWAGVVLAPVFFLVAALFWRSAPTWLVLLAVAAFVGGFATLVARMPDRRDGDGWDDGAVL